MDKLCEMVIEFKWLAMMFTFFAMLRYCLPSCLYYSAKMTVLGYLHSMEIHAGLKQIEEERLRETRELWKAVSKYTDSNSQ